MTGAVLSPIGSAWYRTSHLYLGFVYRTTWDGESGSRTARCEAWWEARTPSPRPRRPRVAFVPDTRACSPAGIDASSLTRGRVHGCAAMHGLCRPDAR